MVRVTDYLAGRIERVNGEGVGVYLVFWKDNLDNGIHAIINYERLIDLVDKLDRFEINYLEANLLTDEGTERMSRDELSSLLEHYKRQTSSNKEGIEVN